MENRRVKMTKKLIKDALIELLQCNELNKVTVKAICDLADVNRSTFYDYYEDIYDLLRDIETDFISHMPINYSTAQSIAVQLLSFVKYIKENNQAYVAIRKYSTYMKETLSKMVLDSYRSGYLIPDSELILAQMIITYVVEGSCSLLDEWIERGFYFSPEEFAKILLKLGISAVDTYNSMSNKK